jgi:hypothetical protein
VIVCVPPTEGVKTTEHAPLFRVQLVPGEENVPAPLLVKVTVPVAVVGVPVDVSVTVAVQVADDPPLTVDGEQVTPVLVVRFGVLTVKFAEAFLPPASVAVTVWAPADAPDGTRKEHVKSPLLLVVHPELMTLPVEPLKVAVTAEFFVKLLPVTETESPGRPEVGFSVIAADAPAVYGPTTGPPPGAPTGTTASGDESPIARARFTRPLPVWSLVPAASAFLAKRPTIVPLLADASFARMRAAAPATRAAEPEVPVTAAVPPPGASAVMPTPGAATNVSVPKLLPDHRASFWSVAETPTTFASPAGYVGSDEALFPVAATRTAPAFQA